MLTLLKIKNIALIDSLEVEFGSGLNLLTGETGSGKSIIVDSLGALTGERVSADLIKEGEQSATIEGLFSLPGSKDLIDVLTESGIEADDSEIIIRRELSAAGKNRVFVNNQLVTQGFLKRIGAFLVDIHGQGDQASLFDPAMHLEMLDEFASVGKERERTGDAHRQWSATRKELSALRQDESDKLQLLDILRFQVDEISRAGIKPGEDSDLEEEKRRLNNVEKLSSLSGEAYTLLYEQDESTIATFDKAAKKITELADYDTRFSDYREQIESARAILEDVATTARDFRNHIEFSPDRLKEIENRLAEISRLARKYGGTIETVLDHLAESEKRLENIETAEFRERELEKKLADERQTYVDVATKLHDERVAAASKFEKEVEGNLKAVALDKARFEVHISSQLSEGNPKSEIGDPQSESSTTNFTSLGFDQVEFYFSANPGESPKPLVKVASGGEASRLMLILKTTSNARDIEKSAVFDEIDAGIGGRVAEAVGLKLKQLAHSQQVLCVTHQPQVASLADRHFAVEKNIGRNKTTIGIQELTEEARVEEIARMLAGEKITDSARKHAAEMVESGKEFTAEAEAERKRKGGSGLDQENSSELGVSAVRSLAMPPVILANVIRGETVESVHRGHLIVIDGAGETLLTLGSPQTVTFYRSACKAFQALPFITSGAADEHGYSEEEIALACASHSGEARHVRVAQLMLERSGLTEAHLRCGTHLPFNEKEAERMQRAGEYPTQLHNNCSGKHAAMLAFGKHIDADLATYDLLENPVQQAILETIALFSEVPVNKIKTGVDGCAAPNFAIPLSAMAKSFINLISPPDSFRAPVREASRRIVSAMVNFPELIGGNERLDTMLMLAAPGKIISKVGAEGVWLCAILPSEKYPTGLSIALKIEDGDDRRARPVVAVELLKRLGMLSPDDLPELSPTAIKNRRGDSVGEVIAKLD